MLWGRHSKLHETLLIWYNVTPVLSFYLHLLEHNGYISCTCDATRPGSSGGIGITDNLMGVCIETYRICIGLFNSISSLNYLFSKTRYILYMLEQGLITWIYMLLILSGDIESNPGPNIINGFLLNTRSIKSVNRRRNKLAEFQSLVALKKCNGGLLNWNLANCWC